MEYGRESLLRVNISTVNLFVTTSSDQLSLVMKLLSFVLSKRAVLTKRSTVPSLPSIAMIYPVRLFTFNHDNPEISVACTINMITVLTDD